MMKLGSLVLALTALGVPVSKLTPEDFVIAGVSEGMDAAAVRKTVGKPQSIRTSKNPFDPASKLMDWHYDSLSVAFVDGTVNATTLTAPNRATKRGLRVGDSAEKLRGLYGEPDGKYQADWEYVDPKEETHVLRITVKNGRVTRILAGRILD
jgi:hypothetical protein